MQTTVKIYCRCLRPDIEYKTLVINYQTSCKELIMMLLNKAKMKHRDPKLFYLTMEVGVRKSGTHLKALEQTSFLFILLNETDAAWRFNHVLT